MMQMSIYGYAMMQMSAWEYAYDTNAPLQVCHDANVPLWVCECLFGACHDANALCRDAMNANARLGMQWMQMSP